MRILLKILITGLLCLLVLALGKAVVAQHRPPEAALVHHAHPVVVRMVLNPAEHPKTVLPVRK